MGFGTGSGSGSVLGSVFGSFSPCVLPRRNGSIRNSNATKTKKERRAKNLLNFCGYPKKGDNHTKTGNCKANELQFVFVIPSLCVRFNDFQFLSKP